MSILKVNYHSKRRRAWRSLISISIPGYPPGTSTMWLPVALSGVRNPSSSVVLSAWVRPHLAQAGHQACRQGYGVLFTKANQLLSDLGGGRADDTWEKRLRCYLKPDLLIIDDFALKEFTKTQAEDLYELIERRYRESSMVVTANRSPKDWYPLFPNPVIAESALDRLISCSHVITLTGKSYRALLRPDKDLEKEVVAV